MRKGNAERSEELSTPDQLVRGIGQERTVLAGKKICI